MDMPIIEVKELYKTFETKDRTVEALKNINFSVEPGDIYGIIGMSGAGKSTLVRCLNFLEVPTKGAVIVEGNNLGELTPPALRELRSSIGMIFQSFNLLMQSNVMDNFLAPDDAYALSKISDNIETKDSNSSDVGNLNKTTEKWWDDFVFVAGSKKEKEGVESQNIEENSEKEK